MRILVLILLFLISGISIYSQKTDTIPHDTDSNEYREKLVELKDIVFINLICYTKENTKTPFTGSIVVYNGFDGLLLSKNTIKNGRQNGPLIKYFDNSKQIKSLKYSVNDTEQGPYLEYFEDGKIATLGQYKDGVESGIWYSFDEDGNIIDKKVYHTPPLWHKHWLAYEKKINVQH